MIEIRVVRSFVLIILLNFVIHTWGAVSVHGLRVHGLSRLISYGLRGLSVCGLRRWSVYDLKVHGPGGLSVYGLSVHGISILSLHDLRGSGVPWS